MNKKKLCIFIWLAVIVGTICLGIYEMVSEYMKCIQIDEPAFAMISVMVVAIYYVFIIIPEIDIILGMKYFDFKQSSRACLKNNFL